MRTRAKIGVVAAGYALALAVAWGAVAAYSALSEGAGAQASAGMSAFGDAILFLLVLAVASVPATAGAAWFLVSFLRTRRARARPAG